MIKKMTVEFGYYKDGCIVLDAEVTADNETIYFKFPVLPNEIGFEFTTIENIINTFRANQK